MKITVLTQVKPVYVQKNQFTDKSGKVIDFYHAVCVFGTECDKIGVKADIAAELNKNVGSDVSVWLEVDTNNNSKPKIIDLGDKPKK